MALNFQDIPIPLTEGQNASADQALIQPPDFLKVTNGEFGDRGNIRVVDGFTNLPITSMSGEAAPDDVNPTLRRLLAHKDEILLETYKGIYRQQVGGSFALAAGSQNRKREFLRTVRAGAQSIVDAQSTKQDDWTGPNQAVAQTGLAGIDAAGLGDYTCLAWAETYTDSGGASRGQICWQIRHKTSDALVGRGRIRSSVAGNSVREARVVAFEGRFHVFGIDTGVGAGSVGRLAVTPTSTQAVNETLADFVDTAVTTFDVALSPSQFCVTTGNSGAGGLSHWVYDQVAPTVLIGGGSVVTGSTPLNVSNAYLVAYDEFVGFCVATGSTNTLRWCRVDPAGTVGAQGTQAFASNLLRTFVFKQYDANNDRHPVLVETFGAAPQDYDVQVVIYDASSGAAGALWTGATLSLVVQEHQVFSQPAFVSEPSGLYTGVEQQGLYLGVVYASSKQNTYQVVDIARAVTQVLAGSAADAQFSVLRVFDCGQAWPILSVGSAVGRACQPVPVPGESLAWHFWCAKFAPNITNATDLGQNPTFIQRNTLRLLEPVGSIEFADLTYMAGGTPLVYDGQDVFEEGFTFAPEIVSVTPAGAGGPLSAGTYAIVMVYEWQDGQGNRWQSAPSLPTTFTAALANTYTAVVRQLKTTLKAGVQVVPYRTTAPGGTVFYRDSPLGSTPLTDTALDDSELLYTGPGSTLFLGTQSNNALPAVKTFAVHQSRLVAVGGEITRGLFYSKERDARDRGFPAEFNRASGFAEVPDIAGRAVVGASLDDKLCIFCENGVAVIFGQGPNDNWLQNGYTAPVRIQAAEGIRYDTPFLGEVDDGVWYVTGSGPRLLSRGLATARGPNDAPLGDELRGPNQNIISSCESVFAHPTKPQVYFSSRTDGLCYVYDYQRDKWTQRTDDPLSLSQAVARGFRYSINDGEIGVDADTLRYEDPASLFATTLFLEMGWISFAGVQRFQRFTHLQVLGTTMAKPVASSFTVGLGVYNPDNPAVLTQNTSLPAVGAGGVNFPWMCEFQIHRQTDTAYKLAISVAPQSNKGGNFSITSLLARVGSKRGGAKLPNAQRG